MVFNSINILVFFLIVFLIYWFVLNDFKKQNVFLLLISYYFYAFIDWRFLIFLISVSVFNYYIGLLYVNDKFKRYQKYLLYVALFQGIGGFILFKYFNFFILLIIDFFKLLSISSNLSVLNILVPVGISFFTFRTLSYILDIDKGKIQPTKNLISFLNYISFFSCILSGLIDRSSNAFLLQLEKSRIFDYDQIVDVCRQILWGIFKKVVVADNCANITNNDTLTLLKDGSIVCDKKFMDTSVLHVNKEIDIQVLKPINYIRNFKKLSKLNQNKLEDFIKHLVQLQIEVILSPYYLHLYKFIENSGNYNEVESKKYYIQLSKKLNLKLHGSYNPY